MRIYSENCFNVPEDSEKKNLCIYIYVCRYNISKITEDGNIK